MRILMLSMYDNEQYFFEALKAGASGYVLKSVADQDLVEAGRAAMRGEPFLYPAAITALIRDPLRHPRRTRRAMTIPRTQPAPHRGSNGVPALLHATSSPASTPQACGAAAPTCAWVQQAQP
jgi:hypothetical protein